MTSKTANGFNLFLKRGAYFTRLLLRLCQHEDGARACDDRHRGLYGWSRHLIERMVGPEAAIDDARGDLGRGRALSDCGDILTICRRCCLRLLRAERSASELRRLTEGLDDRRRGTAGDQGRAKLFGISLKDRAAILPSGHAANGAFWIDNATGRFVTSTYYTAKLPEWATKFNKGPRIAQAVKEARA